MCRDDQGVVPLVESRSSRSCDIGCREAKGDVERRPWRRFQGAGRCSLPRVTPHTRADQHPIAWKLCDFDRNLYGLETFKASGLDITAASAHAKSYALGREIEAMVIDGSN